VVSANVGGKIIADETSLLNLAGDGLKGKGYAFLRDLEDDKAD
jgi:hypothetical protein